MKAPKGRLLYVKTRKAWRSWLARHHRTAPEVWLVYYRKHTGKPRIPYSDAVEEALCYGWIDSTQRTINADCFAQRFTPRKPSSRWSEMNKERARRLIRQGKMTTAGLAALKGALDAGTRGRLAVAPDIRRALQRQPRVWNNFQKFPRSYRRIRIGWIEAARSRPKLFRQRLRYFLKMTAENARFGMVQ
ncbi:MAG TPA: YdeI/OmpD-associated family protein [bacterium]|jgi:uncharacterized protein YdeI (YjbR/CyaY-like superfamily)|nr:YdeI/OmpD-associated family protein [bacterium]